MCVCDQEWLRLRERRDLALPFHSLAGNVLRAFALHSKQDSEQIIIVKYIILL